MLCIILFVLIWGPSQLTFAEDNSNLSNVGNLKKIGENATTETEGKLYKPSSTKIISTTPTLNRTPTSDGPLSVLPSTNITRVVKLSDIFKNSSSKSEKPYPMIGKTNIVVTEGGSNVTTLDTSGTNFRLPEISSKTIVAEGGVQESSGERVLPNSTAVTTHSELDPHSVIMEGISSMNEGKIIARKGVVLDNTTVDENDHGGGESDKNNSITNGYQSHVRKPKPVVTDDNNEASTENIQKMDYVIPIVCTVFSVPLLVVLAIYLYKRGSDLWERRQYNRMDFLIEGIYNE